MELKDKILTCRVCGKTFLYTALEAEMHPPGYEPTRCSKCKWLRGDTLKERLRRKNKMVRPIGSGRWQKELLAKLENEREFYLVDCLPYSYSLEEYRHLHRAALGLMSAGKLSIRDYNGGGKRVLVQCVGLPKPLERPDPTTTHKINREKA